jgi:hypothetical protein
MTLPAGTFAAFLNTEAAWTSYKPRTRGPWYEAALGSIAL